MPELKILHLPNKLLRERAQPVGEFDSELEDLVQALFATMHKHEGIGLAAPQVGILKQVAVIDIEGEAATPLVLVNPSVTVLDSNRVAYEEGCLSIPELRATIERPKRIRLSAQSASGASYELEAEGLLGICIQHECDHLQGKLYIDYLPLPQRAALLQRYRKARAR